MNKVFCRKITSIILSMIDVLLYPLEYLGFRRNIIGMPGQNWARVSWKRIFYHKLILLLLYKFESISLDIFFNLGKIKEASDVAKSVTKSNYRNLTYKNLNLWELAKVTILAAMAKGSLEDADISENELKLIRYYYYQTVLAIDASIKLFTRNRPWAILVNQGGAHFIRASVEIARRMHINTVATEGCLSSKHFHCDNTLGAIVNRYKMAKLGSEIIEAISLTSTQKIELQAYISNINNNKAEEHATGKHQGNIDIREELSIPKSKKIAILIGQVHTDASIILDSKIFQNSANFYCKVSEVFSKKDEWILVIRLHPKEHGGKSWAGVPNMGGGPPNLQTFDEGIPYNDLTKRLIEKRLSRNENTRLVYTKDIDTSKLLDIADLGITLTSQAGFEFLLRNKRLVVAGNAFYAGKGFSYDVPHPDMLNMIIETAITNLKLSEKEQDLLMKYAYLYFTQQLFRRDLEGQWSRFFLEFDKHWGNDIRSRILRHYCSYLDSNKEKICVPKQC